MDQKNTCDTPIFTKTTASGPLLSYVLVCAITTRTWLLAFCHKMTGNSLLLSLYLRDDRPAICAFLAVFFRPYGAPHPPSTLSNVTMATALHHHHLHPQQHTSTPRVADCVTAANDKLAVIRSHVSLKDTSERLSFYNNCRRFLAV